MQFKFLFFFLFITFQSSFGQQFYFNIISESKIETNIIDSIGYQKKHNNVKSILDEEKKFKTKITNAGFLEASFEAIKKINDSTFQTSTSIGNQKKYTYIYIGEKNRNENPQIFISKEDTIKIKTEEVEKYINQLLILFEKKGYALVKIRLKNHQLRNSILHSEIEITNEKLRKLDQIVINGHDKFPKNYTKNLTRLYKRKIFNQENLKQLYNDVSKIRFVKQTKFPEILFTTDSTKAYVYLEKNKANTFDGFIGFTNNEQKKIIFNGYLDLQLQNILNGGEKINIFWKSDGNNQKTFNALAELPYLMKSPLGIKAQLNIFKQDSIFQNTQTNLDLGYYFSYSTRVYLGYQETESSNIQNTTNSTISDFKNKFITSDFEYFNNNTDSFLFQDKTFIKIKLGTGKRNAKLYNNNQFLAKIDIGHNFYLNQKNIFFIRTQNAYLKSNNYFINELFRFGGINSIRGFNENSLQGNFFSSIITEYRYIANQNLYLHTIIDYGYSEDKATNQRNNLLGLGIGLGLSTKNGLLKLIYSNGSTQKESIKLSNSIIQISFNTFF